MLNKCVTEISHDVSGANFFVYVVSIKHSGCNITGVLTQYRFYLLYYGHVSMISYHTFRYRIVIFNIERKVSYGRAYARTLTNITQTHNQTDKTMH